MSRVLTFIALFAATACALVGPARAAPDGARAMRDVLALSGSIGPRKTGTDADRRAVEYVRGAMEAAGLQVTVQEVTALFDAEGERAVGSWNVLGRLAGDAPDLIVVAAHHDSHGALVPGANDDASGLAVLLEVARATAARPRRASYLFASFCAEEEGLLGSNAFVRGADLSRVRAVIALELLGRGGILIGPAPKPPPLWAQEALLRAARATGARGVIARPLWALVPRLEDLPYTADHEPFLARGLPAFLLMGTYPAWTYHTSEDTVSKIRPESLERAAVLLDRMLQDLEERPPDRRDDPHYLPLTLFGQGLLVPGRALGGLALAALVAAAALALTRPRLLLSGRAVGETLRVLIVTGAATALGLCGPFASELLMERLHAVRFPWSAHQGLHMALGLAALTVSAWLGLKLFRRIKPTIDPGPYFAAALLLPLAGTAAGLRAGRPELAALGAAPVLALILSRFVSSIARKLALGALGAVPFLLLMTPEDYRAAVELGGYSFSLPVLFAALFAVSVPFVLYLAHVASFQDCLHSPVWWWFSGRWVGFAGLAAWLGLAVPCALLPAYSSSHRRIVEVRQRVDLAQGRAQAVIHSSDSLDGVRLRGLDGRVLHGGERLETLKLLLPSDRIAFEAKAEESVEGGERVTSCATSLKAPRPVDRVSYLFTSRSGFRVPGRDAGLRHAYTWSEVARQVDPRRTFRLALPEGGDLAISLRAEFSGDLLGLDPEGEGCVFAQQGTITASRRPVEPTPGQRPAGEASPTEPSSVRTPR